MLDSDLAEVILGALTGARLLILGAGCEARSTLAPWGVRLGDGQPMRHRWLVLDDDPIRLDIEAEHGMTAGIAAFGAFSSRGRAG